MVVCYPAADRWTPARWVDGCVCVCVYLVVVMYRKKSYVLFVMCYGVCVCMCVYVCLPSMCVCVCVLYLLIHLYLFHQPNMIHSLPPFSTFQGRHHSNRWRRMRITLRILG